MTRKTLKDLEADEQEDFLRACENAGKDATTFEVSAEDAYHGLGDVLHVDHTVTVRRGDVVRKYHGATWCADFENDVRAGAFG